MEPRNKKIVVANWKLNPTNLQDAKKLFLSTKKISKDLKRTKVVVCPPSLYLSSVKSDSKNKKVSRGAQDVFYQDEGSYTGEISSLMLKDLNVSYSIVGHSERRKMGETNDDVSRKVRALLRTGIKPILCIGESERDTDGAYLVKLREQIMASLEGVKKNEIIDIMIAYEPVWAIGAREAIDAHSLYQTSLFIKKIIIESFGKRIADMIPILYGGSVNPDNVADLISNGEVDGLLVGRDSLNIENFEEILLTTDKL